MNSVVLQGVKHDCNMLICKGEMKGFTRSVQKAEVVLLLGSVITED